MPKTRFAMTVVIGLYSWESGGTVSLPVGSRPRTGWDPGIEAPGRSRYPSFFTIVCHFYVA